MKKRRCPECRQEVMMIAGKPTILHLAFCKISHRWIPSKKKYAIELKMPHVRHGGYI